MCGGDLGLRGEQKLGNFYVDMWRGMFYVMLPICLIVACIYVIGDMPMTLKGNVQATTVEAGAMGMDDQGNPNPQIIARGPVAAIVAPKQFFADGGGFFGPNSTHPYEDPNSWINFVESVGYYLGPLCGGHHVRPHAAEHATRDGDLRGDDGHARSADLASRLHRL